MKINIQNLLTNPIFLFWVIVILIVISTITIVLWASVVFTHRHTTSKNEIKRDTNTIIMIVISILFITGFHYWSMDQQGLQTILINPYKAVKAANLAPSIRQITSAEKLNDLSDEQKEKTIVIVFKFGCPDSQRLWLYAQKNQELLPSENVLWVPTKESNKNISELVASSTRYPSIHYWNKNDSTLEEQVIEEPTESQLTMLSKLAKEYTK